MSGDRTLIRDLLICVACLIGGTGLLLLGERERLVLVVLAGALAVSVGALGLPFRLLLAVRDDMLRNVGVRWKRRAGDRREARERHEPRAP